MTADKDLVEIFQKVQWLFDTHYRAWLTGQLIASGKYGIPSGTCTDPMEHIIGPITLYPRISAQMLDVLPSSFERVFVGVIYVAPDQKVHRIGFNFEREMLGMLRTRSATNGRCTELFDQQNIHINLGPINPGAPGGFVGIGVDNGNWTTLNDTKIFLPALDVVHVISCQERHAVG